MLRADYDWGNIAFADGKLPEAIAHFRSVVFTRPDYPSGYASLGLALYKNGDGKGAIDAWQRALAIKPDQPDVQNNLAWLLATFPDASLRNGTNAVALAEQVNRFTGGGNWKVLRTLAAVSAEVGRFQDAAATAQQAEKLAGDEKSGKLFPELMKEAKMYKMKKPIRTSRVRARRAGW